ncbi:MAG: glutathione S-transferase family protein [Burkholderiales bacterium]
MTTCTLYGARGSGAAAVEAALAIAQLPFRRVDAASWEPGPGLDALKEVNPLAQIPTLVLPDGAVMTESAAILIHLGLAHPASGLLATDASQRAQSIRGLVYIAANCYSAIGIIDYPERYCTSPGKQVRERIVAGTRARLHEMWDVFADTFAAKPYLGGAQLGALDILATVVSKWSGTRQHLASSRPAFSKHLHEVERDARVAPVFMRYWPPA